MLIITRRALLGTLLQQSLERVFPGVSTGADLDHCRADVGGDGVVIVDSGGVASMTGFELVAALMNGGGALRPVLLVDSTSDLLLHCARRAGACAVASTADAPGTIAELARSAEVGRFRVTPRATPPPNRRILPLLSQRHIETYLLAARGYSDEEVSARLGVTVITAETHRSTVYQRLGIHSFADLVRHAMRHGLFTPDQLVDTGGTRRCTRIHDRQAVASRSLAGAILPVR